MLLEKVELDGIYGGRGEIFESGVFRKEGAFISALFDEFFSDDFISVVVKWKNRVAVFLEKREKPLIELGVPFGRDIEEVSSLGHFLLETGIDVVQH